MRVRTTSALAAFAGALVAAAVLGAPTAAQAVPEAIEYPAPAPVIRVSSGTVTAGHAVRLAGRKFIAGEPISIRVRYRSSDYGGHPARISGDRRADEDGRFRARIRFTTPGYVTIKVVGKQSHETATVTVRVLGWRHHNDDSPWDGDFFVDTPLAGGPFGGWSPDDHPAGFFGPFGSPFRPAGNETSISTAAGEVTAPVYGADLVAGLLGLTALIGSGFITRRRRTT